MKITYLRQAGIMIEKNGFRVMIDPYFSDAAELLPPESTHCIPENAHVDECFLNLRPDVLIFTHCHADHYDPETVKRYLNAYSGITVLAPGSVWPEVRKINRKHNYVLFNRKTLWSEGGFTFKAVKAEHSDEFAIGVLVSDKNTTFYITGDTLYNDEIFTDLPEKIDAVILPVNGVGNNMNMADASLFAGRCGASWAVPIHIGLFDTLKGSDFPFERKIVPEFFHKINIPED